MCHLPEADDPITTPYSEGWLLLAECICAFVFLFGTAVAAFAAFNWSGWAALVAIVAI
jgi:hypothetical protein